MSPDVRMLVSMHQHMAENEFLKRGEVEATKALKQVVKKKWARKKPDKFWGAQRMFRRYELTPEGKKVAYEFARVMGILDHLEDLKRLLGGPK